jgi:hypothetical protein
VVRQKVEILDWGDRFPNSNKCRRVHQERRDVLYECHRVNKKRQDVCCKSLDVLYECCLICNEGTAKPVSTLLIA